MSQQIVKLGAVLAEIDQYFIDDKPHVFSIGYCKTNGELGSKNQCRKSGSVPLNGAPKEPTKFKTNVKKSGILLLHDMEADRPFSIRINLITHYNGMRVWH